MASTRHLRESCMAQPSEGSRTTQGLPKSELRRQGTSANRRRSHRANERPPCDDVRELALLARKKIQRQKRLLSETDQLLRSSRDLVRQTHDLTQKTS
jgi:hypothetical protein